MVSCESLQLFVRDTLIRMASPIAGTAAANEARLDRFAYHARAPATSGSTCAASARRCRISAATSRRHLRRFAPNDEAGGALEKVAPPDGGVPTATPDTSTLLVPLPASELL